MKRLRGRSNSQAGAQGPIAGKKARHLRLVQRKMARQRCTLLDLVRRVQDTGLGDAEVVATIARLIESGRVVLYGTIAGVAAGRSKARTPTADDDTTPAVSTGKVRFAR